MTIRIPGEMTGAHLPSDVSVDSKVRVVQTQDFTAGER